MGTKRKRLKNKLVAPSIHKTIPKGVENEDDNIPFNKRTRATKLDEDERRKILNLTPTST